MLEPLVGECEFQSSLARVWWSSMMLKYALALVFVPTVLLADTLPDEYRLFYTTDDGISVIQTADWEVRWTRGDWNGLSIVDRSENRNDGVRLQEDGPAPHVLVDFAPSVEICDRHMAVVTFAYEPSFLRETSDYSYLRVLFDPVNPTQSWQIWDTAAQELAFAYPAADLPHAYSMTCGVDEIQYVPLR